jgi:hypothetical protein
MKSKKAPVYLVFADTPRIYRRLEQIPPGYKVLKNPNLAMVRGVPMQDWEPEMFETDHMSQWTELRIAAVFAACALTVTAIALVIAWLA